MSDDRTKGAKPQDSAKSFLGPEPATLAEAIELDAAMPIDEVIAEIRLVRWMNRERGPYPEIPKA